MSRPTSNAGRRTLSRSALAWRSLRFHWRAQAPTAAGVALTAAVLSGALLVGASVQATLARFARERLGRVEWAVELPSGRGVADSLATRAGGGSVLTLPAMLIADADDGGEPVQVNHARVLGVDATAWRLMAGDAALVPAADEVLLSASAAHRLNVDVGDSVSMRVAKWSPLPRDAPLAARAETPTVRWRATVRAVLPDDAGGRFGLEATQVAPLNAVVPLRIVQEKTGWGARANVLLFAENPEHELATAWSLADVGVQLVETNGVGLLSGVQIFLEDAVAAALPSGSVRSVTYLVDALENADGSRRTPYSFVMGLTPQTDARLGIVSEGAVVNAWLAEHLGVRSGDEVVARYRRWNADGTVVAGLQRCRVARVATMEEAAVERERMPAFPGLTDVESCADWDIGMDMEPDELADAANEAYWKAYGPTPKAFLPVAVVQSMVGDRFGTTMNARVAVDPKAGASEVLKSMRQDLDPAALGLVARPVRASAMRAARGATDFGALFLGLSFFLVVAALLLTGLLCALGVLRRTEEIGALRALGFGEKAVFGQVFREVLGMATIASVAGALLGAAYAWTLLWALGHGWSGALADAAPAFVWSNGAVLRGAFAALVASGVALAGAVREALRFDVAALLRGEAPVHGRADEEKARAGRRHAAGLLLGLFGACALAMLGPMGAMAGGAVVLVVAVLAYRDHVRRIQMRKAGGLARTVAAVGRLGAAQRPGRDVAVMSVLACGVFMVCAVTAMRQNVARGADRRASATGGFELIADLSMPVTESDLPAGGRVGVVPLRVLAGEDAGCLNLNAVATPRAIGVPVERFAELGVFGLSEEWRELDAQLADGAIPAWAGDRDTAQWGLKATLDPQRGTVLVYRTENDAAWRLRLVGSPPLRMTLFQGAVLVSGERLAKAFPSAGGASMLLVDVDGADDGVAASRLRTALARHGAEVQGTVERLRSQYRVEATYLDMFLVLGGLGLLVATVGVGLVVLRNAEERRKELAVLAMIGFRRKDRARLLWGSVAPAQAAGLAAGVVAAGVALWPALRQAGAGVPWGTVVGLVLLVGISGVVWSLGLAWSAARDARAE